VLFRSRQASLEAVPRISLERAELITEAYKEHEGTVSIPVLRALTFRKLLTRKKICINPGELIVGERGPAPAATPTYPELCCHTMDDLRVMDAREKISFAVDSETRGIQAETIIPFWERRALRRKIFEAMNREWQDCYEAGIFTEFMEQRGPGHTVADDKIYRRGFLDLIADIDDALKRLDFPSDPAALDKREELEAMRICCEAFIEFGRRHAEAAEEMAASEADPDRRRELEKIAERCRRVPAYPPRTFAEALQTYWFVHIAVISEMNNWDAFNPGRLDQHLYPFFRRETDAGTLTRATAMELLQCFWVKFNNQPAPPKVGITLQESGTYTDFANINVGGIRPDGSDGVNEVSYLLLEVIDEMRLLQPSSNVQLSATSPDRFLKRALEIVRRGWGQPSIFNADMVVQELLRMGKTPEDARSGGTSGCVETGAFGKEAYILTGYFNLPKVLEITLHDGVDPRTGTRLAPPLGDPARFSSFDELMDAFAHRLRHFIDIKIRGNMIIERLYAKYMPVPFLSILISDCIAAGTDYNAGGARYNTNYIQGVGIGSITDSLSALRHLVYADAESPLPLKRLLDAMSRNFSDEADQALQARLRDGVPKYGNDDDRADEIMRRVFDVYFEAVDGRPTARGGTYRINMLPTTCHVYFGSVTGAMPDGRMAWTPLSEGISPAQGADVHGPTGVIKSAAKMDHLRTGGTLLNQKFIPDVLKDHRGLDALAELVRSYFRLGGHHIQFNVVSRDILLDAQRNPQEYRDLIVRVAGYSDYFGNLNKDLQDEIIYRTEQTL
jgi:trans-4-hydroxy-L-proline dehydratase